MTTPPNNFWSGMPVCVLGGSGFLGSHIVGQLLARGARVRTLSLPGPRLIAPGIEAEFGDIRNSSDVRLATRGVRFVFNVAGPVGVGPAAAQLMNIHVDGLRNILNVIPDSARLLHTSSIVAIGANMDGNVMDESFPFNLDHLRVSYVQGKRAAEIVAISAAARGADVVVLNPAYLFGPQDPVPSVMGRLCRRFWGGRILFTGGGGMNCADVRDVAAGHLLAAEKGISGRRYILGGENVTMRKFFESLASAASFRPRWLPQLPHGVFTAVAALTEAYCRASKNQPFPSFEEATLNRLFWFVTSARAHLELGYNARPLAETLTDTFEWHATHGRMLLNDLNRWWFRPPT